MRKLIATLLVAAALLPTTALAKDKLQIQGSTTVGPIADAFAEAFKSRFDVDVSVSKTGSGDGAKALVDEQCDIATMSRFMKEKEYAKAVKEGGFLPVAHVVAMDGVTVCVHPSNPVKALTTEQVRKIYTGEITNWKDLGGPDTKIVTVSRDTSSGTYETFHKLVMNKEEMSKGVEYVTSNPHMHKLLSTTEGAIGYLGLGFVDDKVQALKVDGVAANRRTIASGEYPVARPLFLFTRGYPKLGSLIFKFVTFHLSEEGQEIVESRGYIPVTNY